MDEGSLRFKKVDLGKEDVSTITIYFDPIDLSALADAAPVTITVPGLIPYDNDDAVPWDYGGEVYYNGEKQEDQDAAVKIPTKKASVEASPGAAKKPSTKVSRKPPPVQKRKKEEKKEEEKVSNEESGDESPEPNPPPQKKTKIKRVSFQRSIVKSAKKDSSSTPTAKLQSKDTESGKSSFNT
ncbi:uncharacterized protein LOC127136980 [Lathyrus oleraceus]|uniref:uncharacterized protein LOC127136980 n=1 Tax=Pisum sativum TaxID=3888 RepID=UPI0021CF80F1|nr:uncharacterized protein LOC127136980 [Pisum sativum]